MDVIKTDYDNPTIEVVEKIIKYLKADGVIVAPSDTCYGLICDMESESAVNKVFELKQRNKKMPLSIAINFDLISRYTNLSNLQEKAVKHYFPGRYTLILDKSQDVPIYVNSSMESVGVRIMKCPIIEMLIKSFNKGIITTSANLSGKDVKYEVNSLIKELDNSLLDMVIDAGVLPENNPSKIIKILKDGEKSVLR